MMEIAVTEARAQFAELMNRVGYGGEQILLTRHGKPLVALVPASAVEAAPPSTGAGVILDLSSQRGTEQTQFELAAQDHTPPPRVGG